MANSRRWVKIWHEILTDPTFQDLSLENQARWYNLLIFISAHGDNGLLTITPPSRQLVHLLHCNGYDTLISTINCLPGMVTSHPQCNTNFSVTFTVTVKNWLKYQIDNSAERVRNWRQKQGVGVTVNVTPKEKEKEEDKEKDKEKIKRKRKIKKEDPAVWIDSLKTSAAYSHINLTVELSKMDAWLSANPGRQKSKKFVLNWLNKIQAPIPTQKTSNDNEIRIINGVKYKGPYKVIE